MKILYYYYPFITFMQGTYHYIPERNHVSRVCSVAAVLYLQFALHVTLLPMFNVLYFYISTSCSMCAVTNMAVFCSSLILCFAGVLLRYCLNYFEMASVASLITGLSSSSSSTSDQSSLNSVRSQLDNMAVPGMICALIHPQSGDTGFSLWSLGFECMSDLVVDQAAF